MRNYYKNVINNYNYNLKICINLIGNKKKDGQVRQKRRPGRNPRIPFTAHQVTILEAEFGRSAYLGGTNDVHVLSEKLRLSESRVSTEYLHLYIHVYNFVCSIYIFKI